MNSHHAADQFRDTLLREKGVQRRIVLIVICRILSKYLEGVILSDYPVVGHEDGVPLYW